MNAAIDSINQILPNTSAGKIYGRGINEDVDGEKGDVIQEWMSKLAHFKLERLLVRS